MSRNCEQADPGEKTFIKVTNKDIYATLVKIDKRTTDMHSLQQVQGTRIKIHDRWLKGLTGIFIMVAVAVIGWIIALK